MDQIVFVSSSNAAATRKCWCRVSAPIRTLIPRRRRTPHRTRHRSRPRHHPPLGPTFHSPTHRRRTTIPPEPKEVITDLAQALETVIEELIPDAFHNTDQYANNSIECDHGQLKARLRPMRGLKTDRTASVAIKGHAFIQNLRHGHYELGTETRQHRRIASAFHQLTDTI